MKAKEKEDSTFSLPLVTSYATDDLGLVRSHATSDLGKPSVKGLAVEDGNLGLMW